MPSPRCTDGHPARTLVVSDSNPFQPPTALVDSFEDVDTKKVGLWTGVAFASPLIGLALLMVMAEIVVRPNIRTVEFWLGPILSILAVSIIAFGRWWGLSRRRHWLRLLALACVQGTLWLGMMFLIVAWPNLVSGSFDDWHPVWSRTLAALGVTITLALVMGLTIQWRIDRAVGQSRSGIANR
jgi:hypothetical protein